MSYASRFMTVLRKEGPLGLSRRALKRARQFVTGKYSLNDAYDGGFFVYNLADSRPQAEWLAPKLTHALGIKSMVDLGCATGHWVAAFLRCGVDAIGIEGSRWAHDHLVCPVWIPGWMPKNLLVFSRILRPYPEPELHQGYH